MINKTKIPFPVGYAKQITLPWSQNLRHAYGVKSVDGQICSCYGLALDEQLSNADVALQGVWQTKHGVLEWTEDGFLLLKTADFYDAISSKSYQYVFVVPMDEGLIVLTDVETLLVTSQGNAKVLDLPPFVKATLHNGRCFAITGLDNKVYFSALDDAVNFDVIKGGGWLSFDERGGKCLALGVIGKYLYVFRQHGIERIDATATLSNFATVHIAFSCGKLYANTVASVGDKAMFLTDWGLWSFDGKVFSRVAKHLDNTFSCDNDYATAIACKHGYVLSCKINFANGKVGCEKSPFTNNALVIVQSDDAVVLRGWDCTTLCVTDGYDMLATSNGLTYVLTQSLTGDTARSCQLETNFNSHKGKTVQFVSFTTSTPLTLCVYYNNVCKKFDVNASACPQSVYVNATGKNFCIVFSANGKLSLSPVTIDYLLYKGGVTP